MCRRFAEVCGYRTYVVFTVVQSDQNKVGNGNGWCRSGRSPLTQFCSCHVANSHLLELSVSILVWRAFGSCLQGIEEKIFLCVVEIQLPVND